MLIVIPARLLFNLLGYELEVGSNGHLYIQYVRITASKYKMLPAFISESIFETPVVRTNSNHIFTIEPIYKYVGSIQKESDYIVSSIKTTFALILATYVPRYQC